MSVKDIVLRRRNKVEVDTSEDTKEQELNTALVATICANIQSLGYSFSQELFEALEKKDVEYLTRFNEWIVPKLQESVGADVEYNPYYPNFPDQVMKMSEVELYLNEILHYIRRDIHHANLDVEEIFPEPKWEKEQRNPLDISDLNLQILDLADEKDRESILTNLLNSSVAYSQQDRKDLEELMQEENWKKALPEKVTNKENLAFLMMQALNDSKYLPEDYYELSPKEKSKAKNRAQNKAIKDAYALKPSITTATDILRMYTGLSDGDISLSESPRFKALPRKQRRFILSLFEDTNNLQRTMSERSEEFKNLFRYLHVDEYKDKDGNPIYPKTSEAINQIRDGEYAQTFTSKVEESIKDGNIKETVELLQRKPGMFARKLDEILRIASKSENPEDIELVKEAFSNVASEVDPKILLTLREHFKARTEDRPYRVFFPKGQISKAYSKQTDLEVMDDQLAEDIREICKGALIEEYKDKGDLGKVYISDDLKGYKAPLVMRNLTESSKTMTRGSRIPTEKDKNVLRGFIWWKEDTDNDLSAIVLNDDWSYNTHISYTNLIDSVGRHSGDITYQRDNGHEGESEFIDIDTEKLKEIGGRYVVFQVYSYSGEPFSKNNCKFGFMEREEPFLEREHDSYDDNDEYIYPNTGEIFEPLTVKNIIDIKAPSVTMMPFIYDAKTREVIWADMSVSGSFKLNNVENALNSATSAAYSCVNSEMPNLYDVLETNALARGELTENKEEADEVFSYDEGITPFDTDIIISRFLGTEEDEESKGYKEKREKEELEKLIEQVRQESDDISTIQNRLNEGFIDAIYNIAKQNEELEDKNTKAQELLSEYEEQIQEDVKTQGKD